MGMIFFYYTSDHLLPEYMGVWRGGLYTCTRITSIPRVCNQFVVSQSVLSRSFVWQTVSPFGNTEMPTGRRIFVQAQVMSLRRDERVGWNTEMRILRLEIHLHMANGFRVSGYDWETRRCGNEDRSKDRAISGVWRRTSWQMWAWG